MIASQLMTSTFADTGLYLVFVATYSYLADSYALCTSQRIGIIAVLRILTSLTLLARRRFIRIGRNGILPEHDRSCFPSLHSGDV